METNVAVTQMPDDVDVSSVGTMSKIDTCLPLDLECTDVQILHEVRSTGDSCESMDLEYCERENPQEEQFNEDIFSAPLNMESTNTEHYDNTLPNEDNISAPLNLECTNIEHQQNTQPNEGTFNLECSNIENPHDKQLSEDIFYSSLNLECSETPDHQSNETKQCPDTENSQETGSSADIFYSSLNLLCSDVPDQSGEMLQSCETETKETQFSEDIFYSSLNLECSDMKTQCSDTDSCDETKIQEDAFHSLNAECCSTANPQTSRDECTSLDLECTEVEEYNCDESVNKWEMCMSPTHHVSSAPESQSIDIGVAEQSVKQKETICQRDARSLKSVFDEHQLRNKSLTIFKENPDCDVMVQKSDENFMLFNNRSGVHGPPVSTTSKLISLLPAGLVSNHLKTADTNDYPSMQNSMKPASQNNKTSVEIISRCSDTSKDQKVCNSPSFPPWKSRLVMSEISCSHMDSDDSIPSEMEIHLLSNSKPGSTDINCEHESQIGSVSCLNNGKSTELYPHPNDNRIHTQSSNPNQCETAGTRSWLECDKHGWVYYVKQGIRKCLNVKNNDLKEQSTTLIHSLVCKIFALQLCLKYCPDNDRTSLSSFIDQEKNDAEDVEWLLNKYDGSSSQVLKYSDIKVLNTKSAEEESKLFNARQVLITYPDGCVPESLSTNVSSFVNADNDEDESGLSIKIESVFSLSNTLTTIDTGEQIQSSTGKESIFGRSSKKRLKRLAKKARHYAKRKALALKVPSYVVLERLTKKQLEKTLNLEAISKCSSHCREMTLQLMCHLGLTACKNTSKCGIGKTFSVYQDHNYAFIEKPKQVKKQKHDNDTVVHTNNSKKKTKRCFTNKLVISPKKKINQVVHPDKIDKGVDNLEGKITNPAEKVISPSTSGVRRVKKADAPVVTNIIKFTKVDKNKLPQDRVISLHLSSPPDVREKNNSMKDTEHSSVVNTQDIASLFPDDTTVLVRTKHLITDSIPVEYKTDELNPNVLKAVSKPQFVYKPQISVNTTNPNVQTVLVSPVTPEYTRQQPSQELYINIPCRQEGLQAETASFQRINNVNTNLLNPVNNSLELINEHTVADWSSQITHSAGAVDTSGTQEIVEGIKENHNERYQQLLANDLVKVASTAETAVVGAVSAACLLKTVTEGVNTQNIPKHPPYVPTSTSTHKQKYVSLLNKPSNSNQTEARLSHAAYQSPVSSKQNDGPEIVMKTEDTSSSIAVPVSSSVKADPKQRYALCVLNDKSYLVPLSKGETISVKESNGIVNRLMKHVKGKSYSASSLLTRTTSSAPSTSHSPVLSRSLPLNVALSTPITDVSAMPCSSLANNYVPMTYKPLPYVTLSSVTNSFPILNDPSLHSIVPTLSTNPVSLLPSETQPITRSNHAVASSASILDATKNLHIRDITPDVPVGQKRQHSEYVSEKGLDEFLYKSKLTIPNSEEATYSAEGYTLPVVIKKEPVNQYADKLEADEFNKSPEADDFNESMDCDSLKGNTSSVQQPATETVAGQWQEIWCSGVLPSDEPVAESTSAGHTHDVWKIPQATGLASSGGLLFEKMYSTLNLLHSQTAVAQTSTKPTVDCEVMNTSRSEEAEHLSSSEMMDNESSCLSELQDKVNSRIETTDYKPSVCSIQQEKIRYLKELLCQKEDELKQLRKKSRKDFE